MVEYALLLSLVALALVGTIGGMAGQVGGRFNAISNTLASGGNGGLGPGTTTPGGSGGGTVTPPPATTNNSPTTTPNTTTPETPPATTQPQDTLPGLGKPLADYSWKELSQFSKDAAKSDANANKYRYFLGSSKATNVAGVGQVMMRLVGINEDTLADGSGKAGFTFMSEERAEFFKSAYATVPEDFVQQTTNLLYKIQGDCQFYIRPVKKVYSTNSAANVTGSLSTWMPSAGEMTQDPGIGYDLTNSNGKLELDNSSSPDMSYDDSHGTYSYFIYNEYTSPEVSPYDIKANDVTFFRTYFGDKNGTKRYQFAVRYDFRYGAKTYYADPYLLGGSISKFETYLCFCI